MKVMFVGLVVLAAQAMAANQASQATVFTGAYTLTKKSCEFLYEGGYKRAYISVGKDPLNDALNIEFFGDDAHTVSILLDSGSRLPLGVSKDQKGKVVEVWKTTFKTPLHMVSTKTTTAPLSTWTEEQALKIHDVNVVYSEKQDKKIKMCSLIPTLKKAEKESACKMIRTNVDDKDIKQKDCLKGEFEVTDNDAGQLEVEYRNANLREDVSLVCTLYFDKPMGSFAPAVEQCSWE